MAKNRNVGVPLKALNVSPNGCFDPNMVHCLWRDMARYLTQGGDQIKTLAASAGTQASGQLFRLLFTTAAHGCRGQTATSQRQQAQSSVERDGGAISTIGAVRQIAHFAIRSPWELPRFTVTRESSVVTQTSVRITTNPISDDKFLSYCPAPSNGMVHKIIAAKRVQKVDLFMAWDASLFSRKMAKNPQTPLLSFEDLRPYIKLLGKNWWMMLAFAGLGYGTGRLVTHQMVDIHRATSEILINQSEGSGVDAMLAGRSGVRSFNYYNDEVQNQLRVLRSYDLVGRAIDKIDDHVDHHLVGRIKEMPVAGFAAIKIDANADGFSGAMAGTAIDLFVVDAQQCRIVLNATLPEADQISFDARFGERIVKHGVDLVVRLNDDVARDAARLESAIGQHFRIRVKSRAQRIGQYRGALQTDNVERTSVITMTCTDVLPDRAKRFLDTLAATYIDYTAEARLATNMQTEKFINGQLDEINALTDTLERQVDYYRAQNEILDLTREQNEYFNTLVDLERQLREMEVQAESLDDLGIFLSSEDGDAELPPSSYFMLDDPWMAEQVGELMELEAKRSAMLLDVKPGSYQVRRIDSSAQHLRGNVVTYLADKMGTVERRRVDLQSDIRQLESRLSDLPKTQRDILTMERKLGVNEKLAVYLLERKAATIIARASITPEASLIERARYAGMVGPDKRRTILTHTAVGFLIALALACGAHGVF